MQLTVARKGEAIDMKSNEHYMKALGEFLNGNYSALDEEELRLFTKFFTVKKGSD